MLKFAAILACVVAAPAGASGLLQSASDLAWDAESMRQQGTPMVILYSQDACVWCDRARSHLVPMSRQPGVGAIFRQIDIDRDSSLRDFSSRATSHRRFAQDQQARFTPLLVIYGPSGERLVEPIVGMGAPDFYSEYVSRAIAQSRVRMQPETHKQQESPRQ